MSYFDDNEDRIIYGRRRLGKPQEPRTVACKRCGKDGLHWQDEDGEWVLMDGRYKVHHCNPKDVKATALDGFKVVE